MARSGRRGICSVADGAEGWVMAKDFGAGFHVAAGQDANALAYEQWIGRWSRLFVPSVLTAAGVTPGDRVLDVSTGTGEAARLALQIARWARVHRGAESSA